MKKHISIVIDWCGPYDLKEASDVAWDDYRQGLYMLIGRTKYQKFNKLQYIGITKELCDRLHKNHHIISKMTQKLTIWLGEVISSGIPGKKPKVTDTQLDLGEWSHSYFLELPMNQKKKSYPPTSPITVYNRWWKQDYETPRRRPHTDWPDLIDFIGETYGAKVVWFGSKPDKWLPSDF